MCSERVPRIYTLIWFELIFETWSHYVALANLGTQCTGWPQTHRDPCTSASLVLEFKVCTILPNAFRHYDAILSLVFQSSNIWFKIQDIITLKSFFNYICTVCEFMHACVHMLVCEVREQLSGGGLLLLPCGCQELKSAHQNWPASALTQ